jgi:hypothetical protein
MFIVSLRIFSQSTKFTKHSIPSVLARKINAAFEAYPETGNGNLLFASD